MRDVSRKLVTERIAVAEATLRLEPEMVQRIKNKDIPKGDPLPIAKMAAVQAAKSTCQLIPFCHQIPIEYVGVEFTTGDDYILTTVTVKATYKTGVEMEALTAASVAALTIYDMVKMLKAEAVIERVELINKTGGKSGFRKQLIADNPNSKQLTSCILVVSDSIADGKGEDRSGEIIAERLKELDIEIVDRRIVADNIDDIRSAVKQFTDELEVDFVISSGGTGIGPRDNTPEALESLFDKSLPGVAEVLRSYGQEKTPFSMLSRGVAGIRRRSVVVGIPGSRGAARDAMDALFPYIIHAVDMLEGKGHEQRKNSATAQS